MLCLASLVTFGISRKNETILLEVFYCTKCWAVLERAHVGLVGFALLANEILAQQSNIVVLTCKQMNVLSIFAIRSCMQKLFHCDLRPGKPLSASGRHCMPCLGSLGSNEMLGISRVWFCGMGLLQSTSIFDMSLWTPSRRCVSSLEKDCLLWVSDRMQLAAIGFLVQQEFSKKQSMLTFQRSGCEILKSGGRDQQNALLTFHSNLKHLGDEEHNRMSAAAADQWSADRPPRWRPLTF